MNDDKSLLRRRRHEKTIARIYLTIAIIGLLSQLLEIYVVGKTLIS